MLALSLLILALVQWRTASSLGQIEYLDEESLRCSMYIQCVLPVRMTGHLNPHHLQMAVNNTGLVRVISVVTCDIDEPECFKHRYSSDSTGLYLVYLDPLLIGSTFIRFTNKTLQIDSVKRIVVTKPSRFVDKFYDIYVFVFSVSISVLMGIMLEWEIIKSMVKLPLPVIIGFCSQYILMPLVSKQFWYIDKFKAIFNYLRLLSKYSIIF